MILKIEGEELGFVDVWCFVKWWYVVVGSSCGPVDMVGRFGVVGCAVI